MAIAHDSGLSDEDIAGIEKMTRDWKAAHAARDWDKVATYYTEDAILMLPYAPIIKGRAAIRDWFAENEKYVSIQVEILEIEGYEDLAYVRGTSQVTINRPGEPELSITGKYLDIRRRTYDGSWVVSVDMISPDHQPE
jgi:uncharacterized protein (TIGR02246 family)